MPSLLDFGPFLALREDAREVLSARSRVARFARGDRLLRAGEAPDVAFAVLAGRVRVTAADGTVLSTMSAPALVGEMAVLEGRKRAADVVALEPGRALRIEAEDLRGIAAEHDDFARALEAFADARRVNAFLRREGPFADLPSDEIEELAAKFRPVHFGAGDTVFRQGETGDDVLLVREGEIDVVREDPAGERRLARIGPGSLVGEIAVLTGSPRSATARAATAVDGLVIPGDDVRAVVKRHRALLDRVSSVMQARHTPRRTGDHRVERAPDDPDAVILHDPERAVYLRLDRQAFAIYEDLDGERTLRDLALRHLERTGRLDPHAVFTIVAALQASGFATLPRVASDAPDARLLRVADAVLAPRMELRDADPAASLLYRISKPAYSRAGAIVAVLVGLGGIVAAVPVLRTASPGDFGLGGILVAFVLLLVAGIGHEIAHAVATKAEGCRVGRAGIGLFWFTPVVYVDTSSTWAIPRWGRIRVNAAGPLFNLAFAGLLGLASRLASGITQDVLVWLALANVALVIFNLSPLLEFDGYYVLADLTDTNALRRKAMRFVFRDLLDRPRRPATRREAGFVVYALAALLYVVVMSLLVLRNVPGLVGGIVPAAFGDGARIGIGAVFALGLTALLVTPFVLEAVEARTRADAGAA
jgi:CRP-like cAMP-binding protein/Zn-dependent protease